MKTPEEMKKMIRELQQKLSNAIWSDDLFNFFTLEFDEDTQEINLFWHDTIPKTRTFCRYTYPTDGKRITNDFTLYQKQAGSREYWVKVERNDFKELININQ